jgi:hypothetical protein
MRKSLVVVYLFALLLLSLEIFARDGSNEKVPLMSLSHDVVEDDILKDQYIVVFHDHLTHSQRKQHIESFKTLHQPKSLKSTSGTTLKQVFELKHTISIRDFHGYTAKISSE